MTKRLLSLLLTGICLSTSAVAADIQINTANFPDANFRNYLLAQSYGTDGVLTDEEIKGVTKINVTDKGITNLKGVELFTALTVLDCSKNKLTALDVSKNTKLKQLHCNGNQLPVLNVTKNTALTKLICGSNQLITIDVSKNTALMQLNCNNNHLTKVDVSSNKELTTMNCAQNPITALDLSKNPKMTGLSINRSNIKGANMDALISSLPKNTTSTLSKLWVINNSLNDEGNECTKAQVAALKAKGWTSLIYNKATKGWVEYVGSDKQLKYLVVWTKDGIKATHALKDNTQVKFTDAALVVSKGSQKTSYPMRNMVRFTYESIMPGDVNGDAKVNIVDVTKTISHIFGLSPSDFSGKAADMNEDGVIDSDDVSEIVALAVGNPKAIPATSQQSMGDAFYFYRNDGQFNAFFRDEVEKMEYSNYDTDGNLHAEVESQVVYTADSVYNIPLAAIDSVGFVQPETIFNSSLVRLDGLLPYIVNVEGMTINFKKDMPTNLVPRKKVILYYDDFVSPFDNGFAGIVQQVINDKYIKVICDSASIEDIYDQIVEIQTIEMDIPLGSRLSAPGDHNPNREGLHIPLELGTSLGSNDFSLEGDIYVRAYGNWVKKRQKGQPTYMDLSLTIDITTDASVSLSKGVGIDHDFSNIFSIPLKLPAGLQAKLTFNPFIEASTEMDMEQHFSTYSSYTIGARYEDGRFNIYQSPNHEITDEELSLKGKAEAYVGGKLSASLGTILDLLKMTATLQVGGHAEGEINLGSSAIDNSDNYELSKNDKVTTSIRAALGLSAGVYLGPLGKLEASMPVGNHDFCKQDHYVLPLFDKPSYTRKDNANEIEVTLPVKRDLLGNVDIGLSLYDDSERLIETKFEERPYRVEKDFKNEPIKLSFSNVSKKQYYYVYPVVRLFGEETSTYRANPKKLIGEPINVKQTGAVGKYGGEVSFEAELSVIEPFDDNNVKGYGLALYHSEEMICDYPLNMSAPHQPVKIELTCNAEDMDEDWENYVATTSNYSIVLYKDYANGTRDYQTENKQELKLVYSEVPAFKMGPISFESVDRYKDEVGIEYNMYMYGQPITITGLYWFDHHYQCYSFVRGGPYDWFLSDNYYRWGVGQEYSYELDAEGKVTNIKFDNDYRTEYGWIEITLRNGVVINSDKTVSFSGTWQSVPSVQLINETQAESRSSAEKLLDNHDKNRLMTPYYWEY